MNDFANIRSNVTNIVELYLSEFHLFERNFNNKILIYIYTYK